MVVIAGKRTDFTVASLRAASVCTDDPGITWRGLATAMVMDGYPRATAADLAGMDCQTLRDWVHRFNAKSLEALSDRPRAAGPPFCQPSR